METLIFHGKKGFTVPEGNTLDNIRFRLKFPVQEVDPSDHHLVCDTLGIHKIPQALLSKGEFAAKSHSTTNMLHV